MNINVNVKRNFKFNGKVYNSIEEMPEDIKGIFRKAMDSQTGAGNAIDPASTQTRIVFNGTQYDGIDAMPQDVRQLYDQVLKATETAAAPSAATGNSMHMRPRPENPGSYQGIDRKPTKTESSFSPKSLLVSIILVALILALYLLTRIR